MRDGESKRKDCDGCNLQRPEILPGNVDALDLWELVQTQWRASGFGLIGMDYPAVFLVAGVEGIEVNEDILQKLRWLEAWTLEKMNADQKAK